MKVYAYENKSEEIRMESSSGGMFTTLATKVIQNGGVVYGAAFDEEWNIRHIGVDKIKDLPLLRKSKYSYSHLGSSYNEIKNHLSNNRQVLFTGTPCQIAAIRKAMGDDENLLCVEVICHGAPQPQLWKKYLTEILVKLNRAKEDISYIDFRDKIQSWERYNFTIVFKDGNKFTESASTNIYMRLFLSDLILREGCFKCQFKYPNSKADITLGDLWGMQYLLPETSRRLGTSLVIARTERGINAIKGIEFMKEFSFDDVVTYNSSLVSKALKPKYYDRFNQRLKAGKSILTLGESTLRPNFPIRVARYCKRRLLNVLKR